MKIIFRVIDKFNCNTKQISTLLVIRYQQTFSNKTKKKKMDNLAEKTKTQRKEGIKQTQKMKTWKIRKQANMDDKNLPATIL